MEITRDKVLDALGNVIEPDLKKDIVSQNLIDDLKIDGNKITLSVKVVNPAMHARKRMQEAVNFTLKRILGDDIEVETSVQGMSAEAKGSRRKVLPEVKHIVAIASGKGGVGKSTITANLAGGLAKAGYKVGIVDADIYGPSMPTMFDVVGERPNSIEVDGETKMTPVMSYGIGIMSIGFFTEQDDAVVWRGPMAAKALTQMFTDTHWGELDYLLIDLPPGTGDIHLSLVQNIPLDGAIIVSTPQEVALADARKGVNMFQLDTIKVPVLGLIENMAWFTPEELPDYKYYIFGRDGVKNLAKGMNQRFLGHIPLVQSVRESGDIGRPAVMQQNTVVSEAFDELVRKFVEITK
ncbi:Mrp/NBP35 family ATP-binding protein [Brumimicrobium glaciale]|jgi:ATP-binding protein involved in chromosome partitioning|uniref:Mrp/NBP35 family ATP-binding protein n=1 Tax=Brumimicrobium glaciale TaxID=200475 RepID=UPI001F5C991E|nr:Mrp/NBP35 family ATP-binding protein [Brumimicrobium glaciale]